MTYEQMLDLWEQQGHIPTDDEPLYDGEMDEYGQPVEWLPWGHMDDMYAEWMAERIALREEWAEELALTGGDGPRYFDPDEVYA